MSDEIRYRVLIIDSRVDNFVASDRDGMDISGKATATEIIERLKTDLGEDSFDSAGTLKWLEAQDPAGAGSSALLRLNDELQLEIVVKSSE